MDEDGNCANYVETEQVCGFVSNSNFANSKSE